MKETNQLNNKQAVEKRALPVILFVDDESTSCEYFKEFFEKEFNILTATNITDAWKIVEEKSQDIRIVVSDQRMLGGTGVEFLKRVKEEYPNIVRMLTTAYSSLEDNINAINESHVFAYITKPWDVSMIRTALNKGIAQYKTKMALLSLSGSLAHELRNPLNVISLSLEKIKILLDDNKSKLDPSVLNDISEIIIASSNSIKRSNNIIDITLDSLKDQEPDSKTFIYLSIKDILEKTLDEYGYNNDAEKKKIKLEIKNNFIFKGNENLFIYTIFNLVKNALYYFKEYPDVTITLTTVSQKDKNLNKLLVRDTGPGIPADVIPNLFHDFYTSGKVGGTGLGLAFCKRTMNYFGGNITCSSQLGEWTEFELTFPLVDESKIVLAPKDNFIENQDEKLKKLLKDKSILLAEDDPTVSKLTTFLLERMGAKVTRVENGEQALEELKKNNQFNLVFMDTEMPKMGGLECAKKIREDKNYTNLPIVALTGNFDQRWQKMITEVGMNGLLEKPLNKDRLLAVLGKIF